MPVLQPVSDTASCGPRHVMLLLSLWASSQFLKQTLSTFRRAVRGSRRRGGAGRSAQLFRSSSPSFCVPLIQPRGEHRVTWYAARCEDFLQEPSFVSCLWERSAVDLSAGWKGQRRCSSVSQPHTFSGPLLLQNFLWAHVCPSTWNEDLPLCFSNCTALTVKFPAPYPSLVFVKPLKNIMSEMLHFH